MAGSTPTHSHTHDEQPGHHWREPDRVRDFGVPMYVTLQHEPEAATNTSEGTATDYINAWRKWVSIFRSLTKRRINTTKWSKSVWANWTNRELPS